MKSLDLAGPAVPEQKDAIAFSFSGAWTQAASCIFGLERSVEKGPAPYLSSVYDAVRLALLHSLSGKLIFLARPT
eukprot:scaffold1155_cov217-Pinguiococcus_pyrenoidosus.AAC.4